MASERHATISLLTSDVLTVYEPAVWATHVAAALFLFVVCLSGIDCILFGFPGPR